jgi:hypothetical protein
MLGGPIPRSPRYDPSTPILPAKFASEFDFFRNQFGASVMDTVAMFGMPLAEAARQTGPLDRVAANMAGGDAVQEAVGQTLMRVDPEGFAASSVGRVVLGIMAAVRGWRTPRADFELASVYDLGWVGSIGLVFWSGAWELRSYRAEMAAHLRYLFDYKVAAQNRWPDVRTRREALTICMFSRLAGFAEPGETVTVPKIVRYLRREHPGDYEGEDEATTLRRAYRISAKLSRAFDSQSRQPIAPDAI